MATRWGDTPSPLSPTMPRMVMLGLTRSKWISTSTGRRRRRHAFPEGMEMVVDVLRRLHRPMLLFPWGGGCLGRYTGVDAPTLLSWRLCWNIVFKAVVDCIPSFSKLGPTLSNLIPAELVFPIDRVEGDTFGQ